jgi:outer membrane protein assembly factor BamB
MLQIGAGPAPGLTATQLWKNLRMKNQFNTVAAREGFLYGLDDGMLACVNATTGERQWKEGRYGSGQTLLVDDLVIIQSEEGPVVLAAAGPDQPRELGRLDALTSKTWNHPTLAGRLLLVRNDREAVAYELPLAPETPAEKSR